MKIGDLVRWSATNECWHLLNCTTAGLVDLRRRGIIINRNPRYFFVFWENGECVANCATDLEIISESR
jgi:hypothetical protein